MLKLIIILALTDSVAVQISLLISYKTLMALISKLVNYIGITLISKLYWNNIRKYGEIHKKNVIVDNG